MVSLAKKKGASIIKQKVKFNQLTLKIKIMNKKTLIIIAVVIVAGGLIYFGYQKGFFSGGGIGGGIMSGGIKNDSIMGMMKKSGETVMSESAYIDECKKSDKESQDMCYAMGAIYYRDASFCKLLNSAEAKSKCSQKTIDEYYSAYGGGGASGLPGMGGLSNFGGGIPGDGENTGLGNLPEEESKDLYASAKEISSPNAVASEVKSILGEACGGVKLTEVYPNASGPGNDMVVYVWKDKPTEEKLISAFEKEGYEMESPGSPLFVKKGNVEVVISWEEEMDSQEIGIAIIKGE